ncbi:glycosyltransferase family 2 protein [Trichothermofontia sp.]
MSSPVVSVAMSVYNAEPYLATAIESILNQTFQDFEFIIIDDGSTDHSLRTLQKYAAKDNRIRLTSRENRGIPQTRNEILAQSQGEFIAVMDADDIALPDRFEKQVNFLRNHDQCVWVGGAFSLIDEKNRLITTIRMAEDNETIQHILKEGHTSFLHPTAMIRKSAMCQVGGYDVRFATGSDLDLWLKLSEIGEIFNLAETVLKYRIHTRSISYAHQQQQWQNAEIIFDHAWQRRGLKREFKVTGCRFRSTPDPASKLEYMLKYGWWAFNSRQRQTAILYGTRAVAVNPFSIDAWKLLICAVLKPLPTGEL